MRDIDSDNSHTRHPMTVSLYRIQYCGSKINPNIIQPYIIHMINNITILGDMK